MLRRCLAVVLTLMVAGCAAPPPPPPATGGAQADAVMRIVADTVARAHLRSAILRVTVDGKELVTRAVGESMTGVPATTDMHFRNGAVAISYVSTWLPDVPHADRVTLGQLAQMTSGYVDYVIGNTAMNDALYANPFRHWTTQELLDFAVHRPLLYERSFAHWV